MLATAVEYTKTNAVARDASFELVPTVFFAFEKRAQQWIKGAEPCEDVADARVSKRDSQWAQLVTLANVILEEPAASERQLSNVLDVLVFFKPDRPWVHSQGPTIVRDGSAYFSALIILADLWHQTCGIDRWVGERKIET
jgi:hypothetical protein